MTYRHLDAKGLVKTSYVHVDKAEINERGVVCLWVEGRPSPAVLVRLGPGEALSLPDNMV